MFPKIKGIKWLSDEFPDLIEVPITVVNRKQVEMDLPSGPEEIQVPQYCDLSRLAGVRDYFAVDGDPEHPEENECMADFSGIPSMSVNVPKASLLKAWLVYKQFRYKNK